VRHGAACAQLNAVLVSAPTPLTNARSVAACAAATIEVVIAAIQSDFANEDFEFIIVFRLTSE